MSDVHIMTELQEMLCRQGHRLDHERLAPGTVIYRVCFEPGKAPVLFSTDHYDGTMGIRDGEMQVSYRPYGHAQSTVRPAAEIGLDVTASPSKVMCFLVQDLRLIFGLVDERPPSQRNRFPVQLY